jgi:hypothetical protein
VLVSHGQPAHEQDHGGLYESCECRLSLEFRERSLGVPKGMLSRIVGRAVKPNPLEGRKHTSDNLCKESYEMIKGPKTLLPITLISTPQVIKVYTYVTEATVLQSAGQFEPPVAT